MRLLKAQTVALTFAILSLSNLPVGGQNISQTKIGEFNTDASIESKDRRSQIWICAENAKVTIKIGGETSFVTSNCPQVWLMRKSVISPAYSYKESHGLKIRYTSYHLEPQSKSASIFYAGKFWEVSKELLRSVLTSSDDAKIAEIKNKAIWFDGKVIGNLPNDGTLGKWYSSIDLNVNIASTFHGLVIFDLMDHSQTTLTDDWRGSELVLRINDHSSFASTGMLSIERFLAKADKSSVVSISNLDCAHMDIRAANSSLDIKNGSIQNPLTSGASTDQIKKSSDKEELFNRQ